MLRKGLLGYLPVNVVQAVAGFGAVTAFTRLLSPTDYGAYALGFSVMSLVHTCLFTWLEASLARFHAAEADDAARANLFATIRRAWLSLVLGVPLAAAIAIWILPLSPPVRWAVGAGVGAIVTRSLLKLIQERRRAAGEVAGYARLDMLQTGGGFLLGMGLAAAGFGAAAPLIGGGVAAGACLLFALPNEAHRAVAGRFETRRLHTYAAYGLPLSLSLVMSLALATTDRFVLAAYLNESAVGAYHAGYSLSSRTLDVIFIWFGMAAGPAAVAALERGGHGELRTMALAQARLILLVALPAAVGLALVAKPLAELMVGEALRSGAQRVTPWIAAGALFSGLTTYYFHTAFTLGRRTKRLLVAMAIPAGLNLLLALVLIPRFGLDGALWATTASYAIGLLASVALGRAALPLPIPWATLGKAAVACAAMAAALVMLPSPGGVVELALKAGVGAAIYGAGALALDVAGVRTHARSMLAKLTSRAPLEASPVKTGVQNATLDV
ncbi:polysaccharide biosynthesis protein HsfF [soil metagenome]